MEKLLLPASKKTSRMSTVIHQGSVYLINDEVLYSVGIYESMAKINAVERHSYLHHVCNRSCEWRESLEERRQ